MIISHHPRAAAAIVATATALLTALAPAAQAGRAPSCEIRGATTLAATPDALILRKRGTLYGCAYRSGRPVRLGRDSTGECGPSCNGIIRYELAGRFVAYGTRSNSRDTSTGAVVLGDLRSRKLTIKWRTPPSSVPGSFSGVASVDVTRSGDTAWITTATTPSEAGEANEVHIDRGQGDTLLDSGRSTIDTESLTFGRNRALYWLTGDQPRVAR